jgi:4-hydroxy-tetrahydrodipicolinate synthase
MNKIEGVFTALVTPMVNGEIDEKGLINLIEFQIESGIHGLVPVGTTGETSTLSIDKHKRVIELTVQTVGGRIPVVAGAGANNTAEAIELTLSAKKSGADAVLSVVPYYNKPSQEGLYRHFRAINDKTEIPVILYNVPGRTVTNMLPATVALLAELPNIIGIKEASGSLSQITEIISVCPEDFVVLSGDDLTAMPTVLVGGRGVISVVSNLEPVAMTQMIEAALIGDLNKARRLHYRLFRLMGAMFCYPSPAPVKKGLELLGKIKSSEVRLPLSPMDETALKILTDCMKEFGLY